MYNRYIPQSDGSFRRSYVPDAVQPPKPTRPAPQQPEPEQKEKESIRPSPPPARCRQCNFRQSKQQPRTAEVQGTGISTFLKQLLPKDFDTGDLLVVLLLLLMAGDGSEDQNTALLTLALYLFL